MNLGSFMAVGPAILMYHSVSNTPKDPFAVSTDTFRKQLEWVIENGFDIISLSSLCQLIATEHPKALNKKVVITFDDGYCDFMDHALPVLKRLHATASVFIVTELLGQQSRWNDAAPNERLMTFEDIKVIKKEGIAIGSHTATHANLKNLSPVETKNQLQNSMNTLIKLEETFFSLSYPWGQWTEDTLKAVKNAGFKCALSVGEDTRFTLDDLYALPRVTLRRDLNRSQFESMLVKKNYTKEIMRYYRKFRMKLPAPYKL